MGRRRHIKDTQAWIQAADRGDAARVQSWLARGMEVDRRGKRGATALMRAVDQSRIPVIRILLEAGADPAKLDDFGDSSLSTARRWSIVVSGAKLHDWMAECPPSSPSTRRWTPAPLPRRLATPRGSGFNFPPARRASACSPW